MIRFAVWAAVSTMDQAEGDSLPNQVMKCKERGKYEKWIDTDLQYIADGYSRTGYVNLSDAEKDIPPLAEMLADMRANKFDVLVLWNYDRLGDLIVMIATEFRNQKKQLFSLSQPTPVQEVYNPYMDDSSFIMQALAPIWQKQRISDLRRKWAAGMPKRVKNGLHPNNTPFGYRFVDKEHAPVIFPPEAALVKNMAKLLLEGLSFKEIARQCQKSGLLPHRSDRWQYSIVLAILENPYYAGTIIWPKVKVVDGKLIKQPLSMQTVAKGGHEPIFTQEEFDNITAEIKRRRARNQRVSVRFPLSGLTYCGQCGRKLQRAIYVLASGRKPVLREMNYSCHTFPYDEIFPKIADEIQAASIARSNQRKIKVQSTNRDADIKDLEDRLERVRQSAELGVFTPVQAAKRVSEIQREIEAFYADQNEHAEIERAKRDFDESFDELIYMSAWIQTDDPPAVNQLLHSVIKRILLYPDKIDIEWR